MLASATCGCRSFFRVPACDQIRLAARTSIRTKKVGAGSKKWFDSEIRELHAAKVAQVAAVATAPPPERQLAVLKLEGLKRQLRSLVKIKKKATMVDVFRRLERSEGSGKEYWRGMHTRRTSSPRTPWDPRCGCGAGRCGGQTR
jgi:hypothetical protein